MEHITLTLGGMHCGSCATSIQMYLSTQEGISKATVDYNAKKAEIDLDSSKVTPEKLIAAIQELGFTASK